VFPIWHIGGAMARVAEDSTAFHGRTAGFAYNITGVTETMDGFDREREWVRAFWPALAPHHTSVYVNFLMDEGEQRIRQAYGPEKHDRLRALKRRHDPERPFPAEPEHRTIVRSASDVPFAPPAGSRVEGRQDPQDQARRPGAAHPYAIWTAD
jgi:hypothetical protein